MLLVTPDWLSSVLPPHAVEWTPCLRKSDWQRGSYCPGRHLVGYRKSIWLQKEPNKCNLHWTFLLRETDIHHPKTEETECCDNFGDKKKKQKKLEIFWNNYTQKKKKINNISQQMTTANKVLMKDLSNIWKHISWPGANLPGLPLYFCWHINSYSFFTVFSTICGQRTDLRRTVQMWW